MAAARTTPSAARVGAQAVAPPGAQNAAALDRAARDDDRQRRRRHQILTAAAVLMQRVGFHAMSMQSVATEAGISVGLIYQYVANKEELLQAVIVDILQDFRDRLPVALESAPEDDPIAQMRVLVTAMCEVVDAKRHGAALAYRESKTLPKEGLAQIMHLELETVEPIRKVVRRGIEAGVFRPVSEQLIAHNVVMIAHSWALKHWRLGEEFTLGEYVDAQLDLLLAAIRSEVEPRP